MSVPVLYGADNKPLVGEDGMLVPHARSFATIWNAVSKTYSYRWDEAVRDNPQNALAMRRDAYLRSLLQERMAPTINRKWQLEVDDDKDPMQVLVRDNMTRIVKAIPRFKRLKQNLLESIWYGRYGVQFMPVRGQYGWQVGKHVPVNGDKIQYQWDGTPVVFVNPIDAKVYQERDPEAVVTESGKGVILPTDRGAMGLRLYRPEYRDRYVIHTHLVDDADYFDGEMAGGVNGVGLRSIVYWSNWVRTEAYSWMFQFCEATGMMDLLVFNYPTGNEPARKQAEANAKAVTGKIAIACPRAANERYPAVETVPANTAGMESLKSIITEIYEVSIERLFVGQSMSDGGDGNGELGGTGRAEFAKATKAELLEWDADNLDETLTTDLIGPLLKWNYPGVDFPVRFKSSIPDPERKEKLEAGQTLVSIGVPVKADELRQAAGFTKPGEGDEVVGGQQQQPGMGGNPGVEGGSAATQGDGDGGDKEPSLADLFERLKSVESLIRERPVRYDSSAWVPHTIESGPRKGRQAWKNRTTGEIRDESPADRRPGLSDDESGNARSAAKSIKLAGPALVKAAKRAARGVFDAAMIAHLKLLEYGIGPEDILDTAEEWGHPMKAATGKGHDYVVAAMGEHAIPGVNSYTVFTLAPKVAAYAVVRAKRMLREKSGRHPASYAIPAGLTPDARRALADAVAGVMGAVCDELGIPESLRDGPDDVYDWLENHHLEATGGSADREAYQKPVWVAHTIQSGPRKGRPAWKNEVTGEIRDEPPGREPATATTGGTDGGRGKAEAASVRRGGSAATPEAAAAAPKSAHATRAKQSAKRTDARIQRFTEDHIEPMVAKKLGGASFPDGEPMDVQIPTDSKHSRAWRKATAEYGEALAKWKESGGKGTRPKMAKLPGDPAHGVELKTPVTGENGVIKMKKSALLTKLLWERRKGRPIHTVVMDHTSVFSAGIPDDDPDRTEKIAERVRQYTETGEADGADFGRLRIYYSRGVNSSGERKFNKMYQVKNWAELKRLIDADESDLPQAAQRIDGRLRQQIGSLSDDEVEALIAAEKQKEKGYESAKKNRGKGGES